MNERETVLLALLAKHGKLGNGKARQLLGLGRSHNPGGEGGL